MGPVRAPVTPVPVVHSLHVSLLKYFLWFRTPCIVVTPFIEVSKTESVTPFMDDYLLKYKLSNEMMVEDIIIITNVTIDQ